MAPVSGVAEPPSAATDAPRAAGDDVLTPEAPAPLQAPAAAPPPTVDAVQEEAASPAAAPAGDGADGGSAGDEVADEDEVSDDEDVSESDEDDEGPSAEEDMGDAGEESGDEDAPAPRRAGRRRLLLQDRVTFGEELWGIGQAHRNATVDEAKLAQFDLPRLQTERELADWLGIALARLRWYTYDRAADTTWHYVRYTIPKRGGGERVILAPKRELKTLQRKVLGGVLARVPMASAAHGFVRGRSILTNARAHVDKAAVLRLDLKDFFPSITFARVRGLFIALGYPFPVAATLALLCTEYDREPFDRDGTQHYISVGPRHLVQGAPTSPALANLVAWRLDRRLSGLAVKRGVTYTRYADDLTFSSDDPEAIRRIRTVAKRIIREERFTVNSAKTRLAERSTRQVVTGLVVNDGVAAPRELRRRLRAIVHNASKEGVAAQNREGRASYAAYLRGLIAFVESANPRHAQRLRAEWQRALARDAGPSDGAGA